MTIRIPLMLATVGAFGLSACVMTNPDGSPTKTQQGAVTGALIGGVLGGASKGGDKLGKAAAGAVVGGLIGGAIGSQLDAQARELEADIQNDRVRIVNTGSELIVTLPEGILFATDSAAVMGTLMNDLYAVADNLNRYPNSRVDVIGHTDNTGSAAYNMDLSQRRATAVATVLRNGGVSAARVVAYGRGEDQPVASNLTAEGRAQNRRVEIIIRPTT